MTRKFEERINKIINGAEKYANKSHRIFRISITTIVIIDLITIILMSFENLSFLNSTLLGISYLSAFIFTLEYIFRILVSPQLYKDKSRIMARVAYLLSFYGIVDLISILPFTVPRFLNGGEYYFPLVEFGRIVLVFKLIRYSKSFNFMISIIQSVRYELLMVLTTSAVVILFSGMVMYYVEYPAQPDVFYNAGQGFWWSVITFATVGYGDIYPITAMGKVIGSVIALIGIGTIALPTGIISSAFLRRMEEQKELKEKIEKEEGVIHKCPHCGKTFTEK
ncbi:MAG: potassium channel family protein [Bacteroidetes bacterium]|nr:potassium channel family protein [Bacteroidota bacterium]